MPTFHNTCPRHCYGSCGIISHINGDKLTRVLGDPEHGFTQGRLCPKGYALIQYALDEHRLKYPMRQVHRGSNEWRRISWEQAYEIIATKILELNTRFGSNLAAGYVKGSGNLGLLHQAVEGMFAGLGPHTRPVGNICSATGETSLRDNMGEMSSPDPEEMADAGLIVLWGANPAVTNINQMKFIYQARQNGAPLVVIDPIFTQTGEKADLYIQINPGTDAWLAWGVAKLLLASNRIDEKFLHQKAVGWKRYEQELKQISLDEVCTRTGVRLSVIEELADLYIYFRPTASWLGMGIQRNRYGSLSVKAISDLTVLTGNFAFSCGRLYFCHHHIEDFPQALAKHEGIKHPSIPASREIPASDYARKALELNAPPLKMLWISCGNPLAQDHNLQAWNTLFQQMELIVCVDLYLTRTARQSDLVLPSTSFFEEDDLHVSFWHYWLSFNQKVLPVFFESKSDLQIARELTWKLNDLQPGFSNFPADKEPKDWIEGEISPEVKELYALNNAWDLRKRPYKRKKEALAPAWKHHFSPPQPDVFASIEHDFPYRLLTPQSLLKFHSQYETLRWLNLDQEPLIEVSEEIARLYNISDEALIEIFNHNGFYRGRAKINPYLPKNIILAEQSDQNPVNALISSVGEERASIPYFDCMVNIRRVRKYV